MPGDLLEFERFVMVDFLRVAICIHSRALGVIVAALSNSEKSF